MVAVQWYPGHMEKSRRQMEESLKAVDCVIEVRDCRIPWPAAIRFWKRWRPASRV